jgi:predicted metal-binding membrane protein
VPDDGTTGTFGGRGAKLASLSAHPQLVAVAAVLTAWVLLLVFAARCGEVPRPRPGRTAVPRAMAAFSIAYLAVWAAFGLLAEAAATAVHGLRFASVITRPSGLWERGLFRNLIGY